ncbi:antitoxin VapB family protein [Halorussus caseinilyticus]|uniref:Antitoxin VapB family protein n=1 Tax=Halorussus caseinilyticus TaxID=3034025 RepID=A0ABD5WUG6_9EURY|nr:antitoxin VapB family protein [Halorussus sp. DT72]
MATKNIGIREEVYKHLKAHKQGDESFSDTIERLLEDAEGDWRTNFGFLDGEVGEEFAEAVEAERERFDADATARQREIFDAFDGDADG